MKCKKVFFLIFILIVMFSITALGYSEEGFEIEIPEEYFEIVDDKSNIKLFDNLVGNFSIIVKKNQNQVNIAEFTAEQIKAMEDEIDKSLENANMPNEILSSKITSISNYKALLIKNQCKKTPEAENYIYQYKYIFTSQNNVYYITYSTTQKDSFEDFNKIVETFEIKDEVFESDTETKGDNKATSSEKESNVNTSLFYFIVILILIVLILVAAIIIVFIKLRR